MLRFRAVYVPQVFVMLLAACGPGERTQSDKDRQAEEYAKSFGVDAKVSSNPDGTKTVAVDRSTGGLAVQGGANLPLPAGFPAGIPVYPQVNIFAASQMPSQGFMVQGQTADAVEKVAEFYVTQMTSSGWTHEAPAQSAPTMRILSFKKDNRITTINLIAGQGTTVQLTTMVTP